MMALFRAFAKSWVAVILIGFLILAFGIWGVQDVFHKRINDNVISAGSRSTSKAEFKRIFDQQLQQIEQRAGRAITAPEAIANGLDSELLQQMADMQSGQEVMRRAGILPSDKLVASQLRNFTVFFNPITGAFDAAAYQSRLREIGMTPQEFQTQLRDQIARDQFTAGLGAGLQVPRTYAALLAALRQQSRSADYFVVDPKSVGKPTMPTDADLNKLMKQFSSQLRRPELRQITLVRFSAQALAPTLTADPVEVQQMFNLRKASLAIPEKRSFVQIPAKDASQAAQIAARLGKGEDAAAVARAYAVKPVTYTDATKASLADPQLAETVFGLQAGKASGPIHGASGYGVVRLSQITPSALPSLEAVRSQIEQQVKQRAAMEKIADQVGKYEDTHATGAPLAQAAKTVNAPTFTVGPFAADGRMENGQPAPGMNQKMITDAFAQSQGGETDLVDLGRGEYYALRVDKVLPAALPSLDEARPRLTEYFVRQQLIERLQARADTFAARIRKGESPQAVAAAAGATLQHANGLNGANGQQAEQTLGQEVLAKLFQAKAGEVYTARGTSGIDVVKVTDVSPGALPGVVHDTLAVQQQLTQQMLQQELAQMISTASRALVKPKIDQQLARSAVGGDDLATTGPVGGKPASKAQ